jgi:hypothetical protein
MKKFLPLILLFLGVVVLLIVFFVVKGKDKEPETLPKEEVALLDLSLEERPVVSLTPTSDGHYLYMKVEKITFDAFSMDYELVYQVPGGVQQGVPGSVNLKGENEFEAELLLGSESSGKYRYDEGVEEGTLSLRFRDEEGQLLARFTTEFHLQAGTDVLTSIDGKFKYELEEESGEFFVTMSTIGHPDSTLGDISTEVYGVFSSDEEALLGKAIIESTNLIYRWPDNRFDLESINPGNKMRDIGIFAGVENIPED